MQDEYRPEYAKENYRAERFKEIGLYAIYELIQSYKEEQIFRENHGL